MPNNFASIYTSVYPLYIKQIKHNLSITHSQTQMLAYVAIIIDIEQGRKGKKDESKGERHRG